MVHVICAPSRGYGESHNYYRYPARFSPTFVRAAIEAFTSPGDTVLDPYVGGGTSLVEALALGRNGIGVDISQLAEFVTTVKTTVFHECDFGRLIDWSQSLPSLINIRRPVAQFEDYAERGYYKHLDPCFSLALAQGHRAGACAPLFAIKRHKPGIVCALRGIAHGTMGA